MKVTITASGVMLVTPENETEAYALAMWADHSKIVIQFEDVTRLQMRGDEHWRKDKLLVGTNWPPRIGDPS